MCLWPRDDGPVEITEDLLAGVESVLAKESGRTVPVDRRFLLALVKRIRELESIVGRHEAQVTELREPTFRT